MLKEFFEALSTVVEHDHAVAGIAARSPEPPGLVPTERARQTVLAPKEVDGTGLAIVLREDGAVGPVGRWNAVPGFGCFGDDLLPSELIGIPLRQRGASVGVFHHWQLKGEMFH